MIPQHREPTHPGVILLEEFLEPLGMTQVAAAAALKIPLNRLNEIVRGRRGVTADSAIRLAKLFGTTPEFWMNLQCAWDIYHAVEGIDVQIAAVIAKAEPAAAKAPENEGRTSVAAWTSSILEALVTTAGAPSEKLEVPDTQYCLAA